MRPFATKEVGYTAVQLYSNAKGTRPRCAEAQDERIQRVHTRTLKDPTELHSTLPPVHTYTAGVSSQERIGAATAPPSPSVGGRGYNTKHAYTCSLHTWRHALIRRIHLMASQRTMPSCTQYGRITNIVSPHTSRLQHIAGAKQARSMRHTVSVRARANPCITTHWLMPAHRDAQAT